MAEPGVAEVPAAEAPADAPPSAPVEAEPSTSEPEPSSAVAEAASTTAVEAAPGPALAGTAEAAPAPAVEPKLESNADVKSEPAAEPKLEPGTAAPSAVIARPPSRSASGKGRTGSPRQRAQSQGGAKDFYAIRAKQSHSLLEGLTKRGIPHDSPAVIAAKRLKVIGSTEHQPVLAALAAEEKQGASAEGEHGVADMIEHDGWASPAEDDEAKWSETWAAGLSASDDDSDGDGHEWLKPQDPCTEGELVHRRRKHLERLQQLYELQYYQLQRVLEKSYTTYVDMRQKSAAAAAANDVQIVGPGASARKPSIIPLNKRKLGETSTLPHDDDDIGSTHQHRYNRMSGHVAALTLQRLRRLETGFSYPYAVASSGGPGGSRLRCTMQAAHLPPCYNSSLPYSRFCQDHILNDTAQVLYVKCQPSNGRACNNPVPRFQHPPVCEYCVAVDDFTRNPRLMKKPPPRTDLPLDPATMAGLSGGAMAGIAGDLDFDGLEALVGGDTEMPDIDELAGLRIDGVGLIGGQLQVDDQIGVSGLIGFGGATGAAAALDGSSAAVTAGPGGEAAPSAIETFGLDSSAVVNPDGALTLEGASIAPADTAATAGSAMTNLPDVSQTTEAAAAATADPAPGVIAAMEVDMATTTPTVGESSALPEQPETSAMEVTENTAETAAPSATN